MHTVEKKIVFSSEYEVDIGSHVFPTSKYRLIKEYLLNNGIISEDNIKKPSPVSAETVMKVHTPEYVLKIENGTLTPSDELRLELPYSENLARASFICCGGTLEAGEIALETGSGIHLGGGFHHAFPDHGEGFCVFNDPALLAFDIADRRGLKIIVIDCDLHQGNGTAACCSDRDDIFTFSIHQDNNYPFVKEQSDLDIPLEDNSDGGVYNSILESELKRVVEDFKPDFAIYVAGSDPYEKDQLGGLSLSINDLKERDNVVYQNTVKKGMPAVVVLAGGYASDIYDTVTIHSNSVIEFLKQ